MKQGYSGALVAFPELARGGEEGETQGVAKRRKNMRLESRKERQLTSCSKRPLTHQPRRPG